MSLRATMSILLAAGLAVMGGSPSAAQGPVGFPINPGGALVRPGSGGPNNLSLVISQTQDVHDQVANLLDQLRRLQGMQAVVAVPFQRLQDNFFERVGVDFGFSLPGGRNIIGLDPLGNPTPDGRINFTQGGLTSALPPFGGHDPATEARTGFRIQTGGGARLDFLLAASQGNNRSFVTQVPVVSLMNGQTGAVMDVRQQPFVTGVIPVVGGFGAAAPRWPVMRPVTASPLQQAIRRYYQEKANRRRATPASQPAAAPRTTSRLLADPNLSREEKMALKLAVAQESSAGQGDLSVAEIRRQRAAQQQAEQEADRQELLALIERGRGAEDAGKIGVARVYYRQAATRASGQLEQQLLEKLRALGRD